MRSVDVCTSSLTECRAGRATHVVIPSSRLLSRGSTACVCGRTPALATGLLIYRYSNAGLKTQMDITLHLLEEMETAMEWCEGRSGHPSASTSSYTQLLRHMVGMAGSTASRIIGGVIK